MTQRILSDLHVYDGMGRIRGLEQLAPLLGGAAELYLNGDSCDTQVGASKEQVEALRTFFRERVPRVTFLTGNHDPDISDTHEAALADGRVWLTHGDVFFPDATPWSRLLPELRRRFAAERAAATASIAATLEWRLAAYRRVASNLPIPWDLQRRDLRGRCQRVLTDFGSPLRAWAVLRAWREGSRRAADIAREHRANAQVVLFGHVHRTSVVRRDGLTIINTGAFSGSLGAWCVDVEEERVVVRTIERRNGLFYPGEAITRIALASQPQAPVSTAA